MTPLRIYQTGASCIHWKMGQESFTPKGGNWMGQFGLIGCIFIYYRLHVWRLLLQPFAYITTVHSCSKRHWIHKSAAITSWSQHKATPMKTTSTWKRTPRSNKPKPTHTRAHARARTHTYNASHLPYHVGQVRMNSVAIRNAVTRIVHFRNTTCNGSMHHLVIQITKVATQNTGLKTPLDNSNLQCMFLLQWCVKTRIVMQMPRHVFFTIQAAKSRTGATRNFTYGNWAHCGQESGRASPSIIYQWTTAAILLPPV